MNNSVKIALYAVLGVLAIWLGLAFYSEFKRVTAGSENATSAETSEVATLADPQANATNQPDTNTSGETTNVATDATNTVVSQTDTNQTTNVVAEESTNEVEQTNTAATTGAPVTPAKPAKKIGNGKMMGYLGALLGVVIILGLLTAYDVTQFLGNRTVDFLFNEDLKGVYNKEYEEAENAWANGKPLDAIQMMRDYLKKNPREQYVALRIAEIYEKDLGNYLAAALEYEQVLQYKLPRERWGWAAIHLCNLYTKLNKSEQCVAMLRRIDSEYGETAAAKKARKRLALYEAAGDDTALGTDAPEDPSIPEAPAKPAVKVVPKKKVEEPPASNLPPGFRPKK